MICHNLHGVLAYWVKSAYSKGGSNTHRGQAI
jgi:hypothetical protein